MFVEPFDEEFVAQIERIFLDVQPALAEEAKNFWGRHPDHARLAAELSPRIYHSVRIYNGQLTAGIAGPDSLRLNTVKYYDFGESPTWRGLRLLEEDRAASPPAD